jgi:hypothetical protein
LSLDALTDVGESLAITAALPLNVTLPFLRDIDVIFIDGNITEYVSRSLISLPNEY